MTKVALFPRMWAAACVHGPKHAYAGLYTTWVSEE